MMMRYLCILATSIFLLRPSVSVVAAGIEAVGVLGNSGEAGSHLILSAPDSLGASGVFLDADTTVWLGGGDCINHTRFDGKLIERFALEPAGSRVDSWMFAELDGVLYFFGHLPQPDPQTRSDAALFNLPMQPGSVAGECRLFPEIPPHRTGVLAAQTLDGRLVVMTCDKEGKGWSVCLFNPATLGIQPLFTVPEAEDLYGLVVDRDGKVVYVGGYFGKDTSGANPGMYRVNEVVGFDFLGKVQSRVTTIAGPGSVSLAGGVLWDGMSHGMLARQHLRDGTVVGVSEMAA